MGELEGEWTLIGGLMVQLHVARYGAGGVRPTDHLDILANSRKRPSFTERISERLAQLGFELATPVGLSATPSAVGCRASRRRSPSMIPTCPTSSPRNRSASRAPRVACSLARAAGSRRPSLDRGPASSPATAGVSRR